MLAIREHDCYVGDYAVLAPNADGGWSFGSHASLELAERQAQETAKGKLTSNIFVVKIEKQFRSAPQVYEVMSK